MTSGTLVHGLISPHKTSPTSIVSESFNHTKCRWTRNRAIAPKFSGGLQCALIQQSLESLLVMTQLVEQFQKLDAIALGHAREMRMQ